ncbi:MAG: rhomboid family intramembrane serine protease [Maritimibacter sp.]
MQNDDPRVTPLQPDTPESTQNEAPFNAMPPAILALVAIIMGIELVLMAGEAEWIGGMTGATWRITLLERFAFFEPQFAWMIENSTLRLKYLMRLVTYPFFQPQFMIAVIVSVFLLALGNLMSRALSQWRVLAVFFGASIIGALVFAAAWDTKTPLFSGLTGAYALVGGYSFLIWRHLKATGGKQINAFALIAVLLVAQLAMGLIYGDSKAWVSETSGFVSGFFLTWALVPGSFSRLVHLARKRR